MTLEELANQYNEQQATCSCGHVRRTIVSYYTENQCLISQVKLAYSLQSCACSLCSRAIFAELHY